MMKNWVSYIYLNAKVSQPFYICVFFSMVHVEKQNDLELDFKVFFFVDSCYVGIVLEESN